MLYKLRLTRSDENFATVDIPGDFFMRPGDTIQYAGNLHQLKHIIRPAFTYTDGKQNLTAEQLVQGYPILIVSDEYLTL